MELHRVVVRRSPTLNDITRLTSFAGLSFQRASAIGNLEGRSSPTDPWLSHAAGCTLKAPEVLKECPTPSKPAMLKEEQTVGDHHQSPHIRRSEPNPKRAVSHSAFRTKFKHSGPSRSFRSILVTFRSTLVSLSSFRSFRSFRSKFRSLRSSRSFRLIRPNFHPFGSARSKFRSFGSVRSKFRSFESFRSKCRSLRIHSVKIPVYPGSCIRVHPRHIQVYPGSCIRVHPGHSGLSWFMHSGPSRSFRSILVHTFGSIRVIQRQSDQRHVRAHFRGISHKPGHPDLSRTPFLTGFPGPAPLTSKRPPKTGLQAPRDQRGHGTSFRRPFGTLQGSSRDVSVCTPDLYACHFAPRPWRVVPSRSKGSSQPSPSPVKRWSRSEGRPTVHNHRSSVSLLPGSTRFLLYFLSHFQACPGLGTFGSAHEHLDLLLRSPTSPTPHSTVAGARVPTHFPRTAAAASSRVSQPVTLKPSLATLRAASPTLFLAHRG
ncbi:hypothetical protein CRG98_007635 [Punica granatum]|uniref:Uncharacterized protein n=1 Tax=Punica granatum TaxID=22663 RepID=A0A2I0KU02_PUNGR|nr:hypothetical protein CRG98_007635 [Punica granatum]